VQKERYKQTKNFLHHWSSTFFKINSSLLLEYGRKSGSINQPFKLNFTHHTSTCFGWISFCFLESSRDV